MHSVVGFNDDKALNFGHLIIGRFHEITRIDQMQICTSIMFCATHNALFLAML
jgi:hypothetical protein